MTVGCKRVREVEGSKGGGERKKKRKRQSSSQ